MVIVTPALFTHTAAENAGMGNYTFTQISIVVGTIKTTGLQKLLQPVT